MLNFMKTLITGILVTGSFFGMVIGLILMIMINHWEVVFGNFMLGLLFLLIAYCVGLIIRGLNDSSFDY